MNPGYVATELGQIRPEDKAVATRSPQPAANPATKQLVDPLPPPMTPADGAQTTLLLALAPELADLTGAYFSECREVSLGAVASDEGAARRLWEISEALIGQAAGTGT